MMDDNGEYRYTYCGEDPDDNEFPYNLYSEEEIGMGYADPENIDNKAEAIYLMNEMVRLDTDRDRFTYYIDEVT
jgi:hypothetical protein